MFDCEGQGAPTSAAIAPADSEECRSPVRSARCVNPFGETANPAEYVPRVATERALRELARLVAHAQPAALTGAPGLGKTLLLHVLARRLGDRLRCLYLPYGAMVVEELFAWALGRLDEPIAGDPVEALLGYARATQRQGASGLVLLLDDASSLPPETARALGIHVRAARGALRLVLAASDDAVSSRIFAAVGSGVVDVRLASPMSQLETRVYVQARLELGRVSEAVRARFDAAVLDRIYRLSAGVPRRVNDLAASVASELPEDVRPGWCDQRWLGAPLDELSGKANGDDLDDDELLEMPDVLLDEEAE